MSLLMKALEKAAKDREDSDPERTLDARAAASPRPSPSPELTLEPMAQQQSSAVPEPPRERATPSGRLTTPSASDRGAPAQPTQAATVMRASQRGSEGSGMGAYLREHPLMIFGTLAVLFLGAYGAYVYLQISNPGLFNKPPPRPAQSASTPIATPAPPIPTSAATESGSAQTPVALTPLLPPMQAAIEKEKPAILPAKPLQAPAAKPTAVPAAVPVAAAPATAAAAAPRATAPTAAPSRDTIRVTGGTTMPTVSPVLADAYQALTSGNFDHAQQLYGQVLRGDPSNMDALLGMAAIAAQQGDSAVASKHYMRVLELEPRNTLAQAGLISMLGRADPLAAETRIKQLIARDPSAYLYFTLGNIYADQDRWPDAQQAYFQAYHLQPTNGDYAYNLAVGLEHIGQARVALNYYRNALQLAAGGRVNFNPAAVKERISRLEKAVQ